MTNGIEPNDVMKKTKQRWIFFKIPIYTPLLRAITPADSEKKTEQVDPKKIQEELLWITKMTPMMREKSNQWTRDKPQKI